MRGNSLPAGSTPATSILQLGLLFIGFFVACNQSPDGSTRKSSNQKSSVEVSGQSDAHITCWGIGVLEFGDDLETVIEKVGKENVSIDSLFLEGDFDRLVTKVWKGSPKEITIIWKEPKPPFKTIKTFEIAQKDSPYKFDNGIGIGSSMKEIVALNGGEPVKLYGFGWDYGGTFIDFGKGKLKGDLPCFGGVFQLQTEVAEADVQQIMGDQEIHSNAPAFNKYNVILTEIRVSEKATE